MIWYIMIEGRPVFYLLRCYPKRPSKLVERKMLIPLLLLKIFNKVIPCRILQIQTKCKLDGCNDNLISYVMTGKVFFTDTELFDIIFKTHGKHLASKHNINSFIGLEFKDIKHKYTLYGAYATDDKNRDKKYEPRDN